jgi:hypothetical protein
MAINLNNNNNDDDNKPLPSVGGSPYSSNNGSNKLKYALIIGAGAGAALIVTIIYYQQMQLDAEAIQFINNMLTTWKTTNGNNGYEAISSILLTSDFKDKVKEALKESDSDIDKRSNLVRLFTSIMPEYLQRQAILDPSLSNLERGMLLAFSNNFRGLSND